MSFLLRFLYDSKFLFCTSIIVKLLIIPFIYWILSCLIWIRNKMFFILLTLQKIGPLIIVKNIWFFYCCRTYIILFILLNLILRFFFIINKTSIKLVLRFSSIIQISLIILILNLRKAILCMYMTIYIISSIILLFFCEKNSTLLNIILFIIIRGFPLFIIFSVKLNLIFLFVNEFINSIAMLSVIIAGVLFYVYLKMLLVNFVKFQSNKIILLKNNNWILILIFQIIGLLILC